MSATSERAEIETVAESAPTEAVTSPSECRSGEIATTHLSEHLDIASESADPVAGLKTAVRAMADEPSGETSAFTDRGPPPHDGVPFAAAVETLARVALEMDDPVAALDQGAEALAEALVAQEVAAQEQARAAHERWIDEQAAYRHARRHRVTELIDLGYNFDHAVAITNANETEIRDRALAAGRDPMEPIYQYALLNGYRGARPTSPTLSGRGGQALRSTESRRDGKGSMLEALAALSDEAFAEATSGGRWRQLLGS